MSGEDERQDYVLERHDQELARHEAELGEMAEADQRQDSQLRMQDSRLDRIEQATLPEVNPATGALQRLLLSVPTVLARIALGARGGGPGAQPPIGPPGIAMATDADLAADIAGSTILDSGINTIVHADGHGRILSRAQLGLASNDSTHIGAVGDVEITAGDAGFSSPKYDGPKSASVPQPPEVDTAGPRRATESERTTYGRLWHALDTVSGLASVAGLRKGLTSGIGTGTFTARLAGTLGTASTVEGLLTSAWEGLLGAAAAFELIGPDVPTSASLKIHGRDGVALTSPSDVSAYSTTKVSVHSAQKVSVSSGLSTSIRSAGMAKLYGGASASLQSTGVTSVKGRIVSVSGELAELKAGQAAAVNGGRLVHIESDDTVAVDAPTVGIAGVTTNVEASRDALVSGHSSAELYSESLARVRVGAQGPAVTIGRDAASMRVEQYGVDVRGDGVALNHGATPILQADSSGVRMGRVFEYRSAQGSVRIAGTVYLG